MLGGQRPAAQAEMIHSNPNRRALPKTTTTPMPTPRTGRRKPTPRARGRVAREREGVARERARGVAASAARWRYSLDCNLLCSDFKANREMA